MAGLSPNCPAQSRRSPHDQAVRSHFSKLGENAVDVLIHIDERDHDGQLASGSRVWLAFGRQSGCWNLTPAGLGFEFLTQLLAQSGRHRIQVPGEREPPLFRGLLCEFLELLCDRLHGFLSLGFQRTR
jgi:hypothetical protein